MPGVFEMDEAEVAMRSPFPAGTGARRGSAHARYVEARLAESGLWGTETLAEVVDAHVRERPDGSAFVEGTERMTWRQYRDTSDRLAASLIALDLAPRTRVAVLMPDGPRVHCAYLAAEKAGLVAVGIGPRAGAQEIAHLLSVTGATHLITGPMHRERPASELVGELRDSGSRIAHLSLDNDGRLRTGDSIVAGGAEDFARLVDRRLGIDDLFLVNSTSGTTGLPKCVSHTQNRWRYFHHLAVDAGGFTSDDVFLGLIPAPFGFGIWTAHVSPTLLGSTAVVMARFSAEGALEAIEREQVTVLACVSTQFIMMLNSLALDRFDLSSLRVMFTGGEAVPYDRAAEFEDRVGAKVLQFYGSNETGALSYTTRSDDRDHRLRTCGRVIDEMHVRLLDDDGKDVTTIGDPGQAACSGPATSLGYFADADANAKLITDDGSMLTGDIVVVDADGYLRIVGRKSDFIIRGGKNVSAAAVEDQVSTHPSVAMAAAVGMPDPVFGERVCVYVELRDGAALDLGDLIEHLSRQGFTRETFPERLEIVDSLPRSSGGKVAKAELRKDIGRRVATSENGGSA